LPVWLSLALRNLGLLLEVSRLAKGKDVRRNGGDFSSCELHLRHRRVGYHNASSNALNRLPVLVGDGRKARNVDQHGVAPSLPANDMARGTETLRQGLSNPRISAGLCRSFVTCSKEEHCHEGEKHLYPYVCDLLHAAAPLADDPSIPLLRQAEHVIISTFGLPSSGESPSRKAIRAATTIETAQSVPSVTIHMMTPVGRSSLQLPLYG